MLSSLLSDLILSEVEFDETLCKMRGEVCDEDKVQIAI
jgi:hypothetical protein